MNSPNHTDLHRDIGKMEAGLEALKAAVQEGFKEVKDDLKEIDARLKGLEAKENQRKGAMTLLMVLAGAVGGGLVKLGAFLLGGH